ncbi:MAG: molybdenum cofactor guanylyltransferase [Candidatus Sumerlaeaceae bacterium]
MHLSDCCAAILVGGESRRMGQPKALVKLHARPLVSHIAGALEPEFAELVIVGSLVLQGELGDAFRFRQVPDRFEDRSSLNGVLTAILASSTTWTAIFACDAPMPCIPLLRKMAATVDHQTEVVLCSDPNGQMQPFHAFWRRDSANVLTEAHQHGELKLAQVLKQLKCKVMPPETWRKYDKVGQFLQNLNTPAELREFHANT